MTLFGDLDISSIRSRPAHRQSVETLAFPESRLPGVYNSLEKYISQGRQIFYVLPLIEDSEKVDLKSAVAVYEKLQGTIFTHRRVALLHGRMKQKEKDSVMKGFRKGEIDMLVSTTVIEVGIDVPNASVIVIEHAERFGLSQLHQLRGRVGRGEYRSFCVLIHPDSISEESRKRIDLMVSTDDGLTIAEEDLKLRGAGHLTGSRQHGLSEFEFTDLAGDIDIIKAARDEARAAVSGLQDIKKAVDECSSRTYNGLISGIRTKRILEILS
jgi:ATP-dependent DNA helicase RecG